MIIKMTIGNKSTCGKYLSQSTNIEIKILSTMK